MKRNSKKRLLFVLSLLTCILLGGCIWLLQNDSSIHLTAYATEDSSELIHPLPEQLSTSVLDNVASAKSGVGQPVTAQKDAAATEAKSNSSDYRTITLMAVGDNLMHNALVRGGLQEDGTYNYDKFYEGIALPLSYADIKVINQETILGGDYLPLQGYPRFNSPTGLGDSLLRSGFNVVLHASNHAADMGQEGLYNCVSYWRNHPEALMVGINDGMPISTNLTISEDKVPIATSGIGSALPTGTESEASIPILTVKGYRFAILNYTYSPNLEVIPRNIQGHLNILCDWDKNTGAISFTKLNPQVLEDIRAAKEVADAVIVFPHWGIEYQTKPSVYQKEWAQAMADAGADLIIGTHPHVCQPIEWLTAEDGSSCLCYYSLGNYVSTQRDPISMLEGLAWVTFTETENGLEILPDTTGVFPIINQYRYNPLRFDYVYFLEDYTPEIASKHGIPQWGNGKMDIDQLHEWVSEIFGDMALLKKDVF